MFIPRCYIHLRWRFFIVKVRLGCDWELEKVVNELLGEESLSYKRFKCWFDYQDLIDSLLEDKNIVNATKAYEVNKKTKDEAAWHNLLMVLGEAKTSYFLGLRSRKSKRWGGKGK